MIGNTEFKRDIAGSSYFLLLLNPCMKNQNSQILQKNKKRILETWMQLQLTDQTLREDLITNQSLRVQSEELLTLVLKVIGFDNFEGSKEFEQITDVLSEIAISRARQGFSPRETGVFVLSMKAAINQVLESELAT